MIEIDFDKQSEEDINIELLQKRIKELSDHQLFLLDTIENYKTTTHKIISEKKNKISELERKIAKLSEEILIPESIGVLKILCLLIVVI